MSQKVYTPVSLERGLAVALSDEAARLGVGRSELIAAALVTFLAIVAQGRVDGLPARGAG